MRGRENASGMTIVVETRQANMCGKEEDDDGETKGKISSEAISLTK